MKPKLIQSALCLSILAAAASTQAQTWITNSSAAALAGATVANFTALDDTASRSATVGDLTVSAYPISGYTDSVLEFSTLEATYFGLSGVGFCAFGTDNTEVRFDFANPQYAFGFYYGAQTDNYALNVYNSSGNLLGTEAINGDDMGADGFIGFSETSPVISYAIYTDVSSQGDFDYFANVTYTSTAAPEPTTLALAGLGVASWLLARRKQA